jgi:DNA-binding transcriptional regulator YdaS (Cro superfamily)
MDVIKFIRAEANKLGSQKALAAKLGVSAPYLGDVLNGRKDPGEAILHPLGLERVVTYRRKREPTEARKAS